MDKLKELERLRDILSRRLNELVRNRVTREIQDEIGLLGYARNESYNQPIEGLIQKGNLYYPRSSPPQNGVNGVNGAKFKSLNSTGEIENWMVKDGILFREGKYFGLVSKWDDFEILVLPDPVRKEISFTEINHKLQNKEIERAYIDPQLQKFVLFPLTLISFVGKDGIIYLVRAEYNKETHHIFPPR